MGKMRFCTLLLALLLAAGFLLLSACSKDSEDPASGFVSEVSAQLSGRAGLLYESVVSAQDSALAARITKPDGYPEKVGNVLGRMMSLHANDKTYLYHVAFCREDGDVRTDRAGIMELLDDPMALYAHEWVEIAFVYPQGTEEARARAEGWYYFVFTASEIRTLAEAGIRCGFVGAGEALAEGETSGGTSWEEAIEQLCQWTGDSFCAG